MKILLISSPPAAGLTRIDVSPPLALMYLSAVLREAGHEPHIFDMNALHPSTKANADEKYISKIMVLMENVQPGLCMLNCFKSAYFPFVRKVAQRIKKFYPDMPIAIGGIHPTLFVDDILKHCPEFDYIAIGEGETQAVMLADAISGNKLDMIQSIPALASRLKDGTAVCKPRKTFIQNLDQLPIPAWDLVHIRDYYRDHSNWYNPKGHDIKISAPIMTSRSCPYDCTFCSSHRVMGRGLRLRRPQHVVDEMQLLYDQYGIKYFGFVDDNLTLNKKHIIGICNEIIRRGMDIQFETINGYNLASLDGEIIDAMYRAGCIYAIMPIEHGSDYMRNKIIGKNLPREKIFEVAEHYKKKNILTRGVFIMGFPEDTDLTLSETYKMMRQLSLDMYLVFSLIPFPGTKVYQQAVRDGLLINHVDEKKLWTGELELNSNENGFYIRPYQMSMAQLADWRGKFDAFRMNSTRVKRLQKRVLSA